MNAATSALRWPEPTADPYGYYGHLRETEPVHWDEAARLWIVTRYDDAVTVLRDPERFSSERIAYLASRLPPPERRSLAPLLETLHLWFFFRDPPFHSRIRRLLNPLFAPKAVEAWQPLVEATVDRLVEQGAREGRMDLVRDFAHPLPVAVMIRILGLPDRDFEQVLYWSDELGFLVPAIQGNIPNDDPVRFARAYESYLQLDAYLDARLREHERRPGDGILGLLSRAVAEGQLQHAEARATLSLLLFAGRNSVTRLIANAAAVLLRHREPCQLLRRDPTLLPCAVEELVRYEGPTKAVTRWASQDVELGGKAIRAGDRVLVALASANRDPRRFRDAERLDVARQPNPHLGFGQGPHFCLGANLARLETRKALEALLERFEGLELDTARLEYQPHLIARSLASLPVRWARFVAGG